MPIETNNTPAWYQGKRKDGVSPQQLKQIAKDIYTQNPEDLGKVTAKLYAFRDWKREWVDEFENEIKSEVRDDSNLSVDDKLKDTEYSKLLTQRNILQQEKVQLDTTADPDQKNLMIEWQERNLNNEAAIATIVDEDLSEFAELDASINNFELLYNDDNSRKQYKKLRKDAERILKLANPSREIQYRSDGLYVDGKLAEPSIMQELLASGNEVIGGAAIGTGAAVTLTKMTRWGRAFPGRLKLGVGGAIVAGEVFGSSKLAELDRSAALNKLGLFMDRDYRNRRKDEDIVLGALGIPLGGAAARGGKFLGKGIAKFSNALLNLFNKGKFVDDNVIYTLARHGNIDPDQLKKDTDTWIKSLGKGGDTDVTGVSRTVPMTGLHLTDEQVAMTSYMPVKKIKSLHENDQQFLYFINTNPDATQALAQALKKSPELSKGFLLKATKERGAIVKQKLKEFDFNKDQFTDIVDALEENAIGIRDAQNSYLVDNTGAAKLTNAGFINQELWDDTTGVPAIKADTELGRYINKLVEGNQMGRQISYDELVSMYRKTRDKFDYTTSTVNTYSLDNFREIVSDIVTRGADGKTNPAAKKEFSYLLDREFADKQLSERGLGKYLSKRDITFEEAVNAFNRYNSSDYLGSPDYKRILEIAGKHQSAKSNMIEEIIPSARESIENGIIFSSVIKNSVDTLEGISGKMNTNTGLVIDFPSLARDLETFKPAPGSKAFKLKQYIDITAKLYRNDIGILRAFRQPLQVNPASGSSIATSVLGKARVEIASRLYELAQTALPGTKYELASATKKTNLKILL